MIDVPRKPQKAQFINKIWAARVQLDKKETVIIRGREIKPIAWSAIDLLMEAMRKDGHIPHVKAPQPPGILYACSDEVHDDPLRVAELAEVWAGSRKAITGRAHQRNSPVMASTVISLPKEMNNDWPAFRDASLEWLKQKYGERLKLVIEHLDEEQKHIHAYTVPLFGIGKDGKPFSEPFGAVHEGYAESRSARRGTIEKSGTSKGAKTGKAFVDAMKEYQDKFHHDVACHFNLARIGPQMKKLNHAEAVRQREIRKAEAERVEAENLKMQAFEEVRAAMETRRLANQELARRKAEAEKEAKAVSKQLIEDAQERARVEGQRILKIAKLAIEEKEYAMRALISGDKQIAVGILRENIKLKEDLRLTERALFAAREEAQRWRRKFFSAYNWLKEAVTKLESFGYFRLSQIFKTGETRAADTDVSKATNLPARKRLFDPPKPAPQLINREEKDSY